MSGQKGDIHGPMSEDHKQKIRKALLGRVVWNKGLTKEDPRVAKLALGASRTLTGRRFSESHRRNLSVVRYKQIQNGVNVLPKWFDTYPEKIIEEALLQSKFMVLKQFYILGVGLVDFYLPEENIVVEVDGDYWHGKQRPEQQRIDEMRNLMLIEMGYRVLRFWENDVYNSLGGCLQQVRSLT